MQYSCTNEVLSTTSGYDCTVGIKNESHVAETKTAEILFDRRRTGGERERERERATKIEQNLETAVAVGSEDGHKQDRNVTESKRRVERGWRKGETETVEPWKGVKEKLGCYSRSRCRGFLWRRRDV